MTDNFGTTAAPQYPPGSAPGAVHVQDAVSTVRRVMGDDSNLPPSANGSGTQAATMQDSTGDNSTTDGEAKERATQVAGTAKDQAAQVAGTAKDAGAQVAGTVQEQAGQVTAEAGKQAKQLLSQTQSEVTEQAAATQQRVAGGLRTLADELAGMAKGSEQNGLATDLAQQAADKAQQAAAWLSDRDPGSVLNEVRSFARRKPGAYLAIALGAGVLAGRLTRGLTAPTDDSAPGDLAR
ncbi:MAG: hypothetical protein ABWZ02_06010 [Nakamurella sp.]